MTGRVEHDLWLVYDGDCGFCRGVVELFDRFGWVPAARQLAFQSFDGKLADRLWDAGIRNELAVLDRPSGEIRTGVEGFVWILAPSRIGWLARLAGLEPLQSFLTVLYRTIAYNRHLIAPKDPARIRCACDPDFHLGYRLTWLALLAAFAGSTLLLFGAGYQPAAGVRSGWLGGMELMLLHFLGWLAPSLAAARLPRDRAFDWLGSMGAVAARGSLVLLPVALVSPWLGGAIWRYVQLASLVAALAWMIPGMARRVAVLRLARAWFFGWLAAAALTTGAALLLWLR